ncbi:hypothetical protein DF122_28350 [Burkholderia pseudomallei]|uniref:Uncharacterized protein n=2 Tax=pseudomallei group TaxID=111527 RepID=A0AAX1ZW98_BURML|nr:hypothetical protein F5D26_10820 [Burkholderia pseudomallei]RUN03869.1 hypothetical protein EGT61_031245 [Burkholderia mallei]MBG1249076.1 hypothetical protein [Burkholderia pseudomallei]MBK3336629.1 hypothetical protein [Burkholderia pseudomallei]MPT64408.1 hypothetical protein [Burkholderia pseudomallei]
MFDVVHYPSEGKFKFTSARILTGLMLPKMRAGFAAKHAPMRECACTARMVNEFRYDMNMPPFTCSVVPVM